MTSYVPTPEQDAALGLFAAGLPLVIEAGAGTGKTSTLELLARSTQRQGAYVAFNRDIVRDASHRLPMNVAASTAHSLAFRACGRRFKHRLDHPRVSSPQLARWMGLDHLVVRYDGKEKVLQPSFLAGLIMRGVSQFCMSADPEPLPRHLPYVEGIDPHDAEGHRTWRNNDLLRDALAGHLAAAWADLSGESGRLPFSHDHYLKLWQLDDPVIPADFVLFDECQPPWSMVSVPGGWKRIGDVEVGDRVVSFTKGNVLSAIVGSEVLGKTVRHHEGEMVVVRAGANETRYTPNHIAMARIGAALEGKHILYLMAKDSRFRVGVTQGRHGSGPGRTTGIMGRLREERGDAAWVLAVFDSRAEAEAAEEITSLTWRLPQTRFNEDRPSVTKFWSMWDTAYSDAVGCAAHFGRDLRYPLVGTERRYMLGDRFTEIRACNLIDGMEARDASLAFLPITVEREPYSGPVVSLAVAGPATYIADGIITHNCQDASPVMLAAVAAQAERGAQLVFVGDAQQQIYEWRGAINALARLDGERTFLTQSWRFGPAIAEVANAVLEELDADLRLTGHPDLPSRLGHLPDPRAVLCRSNAGTIDLVLRLQHGGRRPHLVGGGGDIVRFCHAVNDLRERGSTSYHDLACFDSWDAVVAYVADDPRGDELGLMVRLIEEYGVQIIIDAIEGQVAEAEADVIVSTAHRAKGREWPTVRLAGDFPERDAMPGPADDGELRLLYVSATRAQDTLDLRLCGPLSDILAERADVAG